MVDRAGVVGLADRVKSLRRSPDAWRRLPGEVLACERSPVRIRSQKRSDAGTVLETGDNAGDIKSGLPHPAGDLRGDFPPLVVDHADEIRWKVDGPADPAAARGTQAGSWYALAA
jgi:hypothetical protein